MPIKKNRKKGFRISFFLFVAARYFVASLSLDFKASGAFETRSKLNEKLDTLSHLKINVTRNSFLILNVGCEILRLKLMIIVFDVLETFKFHFYEFFR